MKSHEPIITTARKAAGMIVAVTCLSLAHSGAQARAPISADITRQSVQRIDSNFPLYFEANQGQTNNRVKFLTHAPGYTLWLTQSEAVFAFSHCEATIRKVTAQATDCRSSSQQSLLTMRLVGANPASTIAGQDLQPGKVNYFIGKDPNQWHSNIPTYQKVQYQNVYPGVDLVYYGTQRQLEYDFVVLPKADPASIVLSFEGSDRLEVDSVGDLIIGLSEGNVRLHKPVIYQESNGARQPVDGKFVVDREHATLSFSIADYDRNRPLVIDPVLSYSTYLGGNGTDRAPSIAVDSNGNAYIAGQTTSTDFPATTGAFDLTANGGFDAYVAKLNPTGTALVYATYVGGGNNDFATGIAIDSAENAYITGFTLSTNFPTTTGAFQTSYQGGAQDAFVTKLDSTGSMLAYSTYLGGTQADAGGAITVDATGHAYVTGAAQVNFPATAGVLDTTFSAVDNDIFVTKMNQTGTGLVYSTAIPGDPQSDAGRAIAVDSAGNAYVAGGTGSSVSFPATLGVVQPTFAGGGSDGFVLKLNPSGTALVYATYLGSSGLDELNYIAIDPDGNAYVGGAAQAANFPVTTGAFQTVFGGGLNDSVVAKLNPTATVLLYSTFIGGNDEDDNCAVALDLPTGNTYVACSPKSTNLLTTGGPFQSSNAGGFDCYVGQLNATGTSLLFASYLGGSGNDFCKGASVDQFGNLYVAGNTSSTNFPTTAGSFQATDRPSEDGFVAKITFNTPVSIDIKPGSFPNSINLGSQGTVPVAILGSATFDASQVDPLTVSLAGATVKLKGKGTPMASLEDVNGDGFLDMVVHVSTQALQLTASDTQAIVEGQTFGGATFRGIDSVRIVPEN